MLRPALCLSLCAAALALAFSPAAEAQWKWKDAAGKIQYSDMPPPSGTPDKDILQRPANARPIVVVNVPSSSGATDAASAPKPAASKPEADAAAQKKRAEEEQAAKAKQEQEARRVAELRRENCDRAQQALRNLQSGQRLTRTNAQGERVFLDESQTAAEIQRARDAVASDCR